MILPELWFPGSAARRLVWKRQSADRARDRDRPAQEPALDGYHLLGGVRADLLQRARRHQQAREAFEAAACGNGREQELLRAIKAANSAASPSQVGVANLPPDAAGGRFGLSRFASASRPTVASTEVISIKRLTLPLPLAASDTSPEAKAARPVPDGSDRISMRVPLPCWMAQDCSFAASASEDAIRDTRVAARSSPLDW
jgi:hypothetical protein